MQYRFGSLYLTSKMLDLNRLNPKIKIKKPKVPSVQPIFNRLFSLVSHDVGIDLGTANTLIWVSGKGIVIHEPSAVARQKKTKDILAIGASAKKMLGKTPQTIECIRPLKDGVIADAFPLH